MNTIDNISALLFTEFAKSGKTVAIHNEGAYLIIKIGSAQTRIMNWESLNPKSILDMAKGLVLKEDYQGSVLLHG